MDGKEQGRRDLAVEMTTVRAMRSFVATTVVKWEKCADPELRAVLVEVCTNMVPWISSLKKPLPNAAQIRHSVRFGSCCPLNPPQKELDRTQ